MHTTVRHQVLLAPMLWVALAIGGCTATPEPTPTPAPVVTRPPTVAPLTPAPTTPAATPFPSSRPATVRCAPEPAPRPTWLEPDPCPAAEVAVRLAVATVRLPIEVIVLEPGPFYCNDPWPGVDPEPLCYGPFVQPGQFMHAWVTFERTDRVAVVMLGRDLPADPATVSPSPWYATLVTVAEPPAGWVLPGS